jgi:hypothetical protein
MNEKTLSRLEVLLIVLLASVPLFSSFPYRINIFLSWEGAYRISQGQLPFKDFGIPLGGMFWAVPALFFKLFGPKLITLIKAQVFLNILSGLAFRSILKNLSINQGIRAVSVLLFCISFSFFNFWPWYNHTVIVYELIALAFLLRFLSASGKSAALWPLLLSALFVCFSFLTKQDGGGLAFLICLALLAANGWQSGKWLPLVYFTGGFVLFLVLLILPFLHGGFSYWFNHGQPPHTARISLFDIADEFFSASQWIKFYLVLLILLVAAGFKGWKELRSDRNRLFLLLLTLGILVEAAIFQVTSYVPPDNNIFFHSFAIACILQLLSLRLTIDFARRGTLLLCSVGVLIWWSGTYWKYIQRIAERGLGGTVTARSATGENVVNRKTYLIDHDTTDIPMSKWVSCGLPSFDRIYMPQPTADGLHRLLQLDLIKQHREKKDLKVLNMSELTPLAAEMPYMPERNPNLPLWFHLGVGMFNRQAAIYEQRIGQHYYDLVLFEYVPNLNNFYPFRTLDSLKVHYRQIDSFPAPRRGDTKGTVFVFVPSADTVSGTDKVSGTVNR